ncbi:unnamed protein product [Symbiodinium natans]|uniref:Uncharacterized protein n=1 Tax=Symbiodinium natans TaxID=878477 RepID=A0A812JRP6_9DINO|nr:unnamed protein product [Symbiodinium natans]
MPMMRAAGPEPGDCARSCARVEDALTGALPQFAGWWIDTVRTGCLGLCGLVRRLGTETLRSECGERSERDESEGGVEGLQEGERWREDFAQLRCDFRRRSRRLEKLENQMHAVTSSCIEAQHHLASLTRERDLLIDCVQELLLLTSDGQDLANRHCAPLKARVAWQSRDADPNEPVAKDVATGGSQSWATPRSQSARNGNSARGFLKAPQDSRRVRFDDKLQESPRVPRQPPDRYSACSLHRNPILKHRPTSASTGTGASAVDTRRSEHSAEHEAMQQDGVVTDEPDAKRELQPGEGSKCPSSKDVQTRHSAEATV